jgi:hypothetical protein
MMKFLLRSAAIATEEKGDEKSALTAFATHLNPFHRIANGWVFWTRSIGTFDWSWPTMIATLTVS